MDDLKYIADHLLEFSDDSVLNCLKVPVPKNEKLRLAALRHTNLLDSDGHDHQFDRLTALAARIFEVPVALVSLVDINRQWFKSRVGLDAQETDRDFAFCAYAVLEETPDVFVVLNALNDSRFENNPLVIGDPHIRFYAGASLLVDDARIGTLCIIDNKPKSAFNLEEQRNLIDIASMVVDLILKSSRFSLDLEHKLAKIILGVVENCKYPLLRVNNSNELLIDSIMVNNTNNFFDQLVSLGADCSFLLVYIEALIETMQYSVMANIPKRQPIKCNIMNYLEENVIKMFRNECESSLNLFLDNNSASIFLDTIQITHPVYISLVLFNILDSLLANWFEVNCRVTFELNNSDDFHPFPENAINELTDHLLGFIVIQIEPHQYIEKQLITTTFSINKQSKNNKNDHNEHFLENKMFVNTVLQQIQGQYYYQDSTKTNITSSHIFKFPCKMVDIDAKFTEKFDNHSAKTTVDGMSSEKTTDILSTSEITSHNYVYPMEYPPISMNKIKNPDTRRRKSIPNGFIHTLTSTISAMFHGHTQIVPVNSNDDRNDITLHQPIWQRSSPVFPTSDFHTQTLDENEINVSRLSISKVNDMIRDCELDKILKPYVLRVLIVEDTKSVQKLLQNWFTKNGCEVTCADNGAIGLALLKEKDFDLAIVDFLM
eukprot:gene9400-12660_t